MLVYGQHNFYIIVLYRIVSNKIKALYISQYKQVKSNYINPPYQASRTSRSNIIAKWSGIDKKIDYQGEAINYYIEILGPPYVIDNPHKDSKYRIFFIAI